MRWLFPDPSEEAKRSRILAAMDAFWRAFEEAAPQLDATFKKRASFDVAGFMDERLEAVWPDLHWTFGKGTAGHRLTVTPEGERQLRPMIDVFLSRAPKLQGWEYSAYVLPIPTEAAIQGARQSSGLALEKVMATACAGEAGLVDVKLFLDADEDEAAEAAMNLIQYTVGEEMLDKWIGAIDILRSGEPAPPLSALPAAVEALKRARVEALSKSPWSVAIEREYAMLKGEPEEARDYPRHEDILTAVTPDPEWWTSAHGETGFSSERFSRFGEKFAFVKIDGMGGDDNARFQDRTALEETLNKALTGAKVGGVVGGAHGLRYSYVDVALNDLPGGVAKIQEVLRAGGIPKRSWILFFDPELADEWVGIYDDTPRPPAPPAQGLRGLFGLLGG